MTKWNPLPERGKTLPSIYKVTDTRSNFINVRQEMMNVGKYKFCNIKNIPLHYLEWMLDNVQLNEAELKLVNKTISYHFKKQII